MKTLGAHFSEYLCNLGGKGKLNKHETKDYKDKGEGIWIFPEKSCKTSLCCQ